MSVSTAYTCVPVLGVVISMNGAPGAATGTRVGASLRNALARWRSATPRAASSGRVTHPMLPPGDAALHAPLSASWCTAAVRCVAEPGVRGWCAVIVNDVDGARSIR